MAKNLKLDRTKAVMVLVDVQERLVPAMPPDALARVVKYSKALIGAAKELGMPVLATEQYPKGLGPLVQELAELLPSPPMEKVHFSCGADPAFAAALESTGRRQVVVFGMETHVCVFQTVAGPRRAWATRCTCARTRCRAGRRSTAASGSSSAARRARP